MRRHIYKIVISLMYWLGVIRFVQYLRRRQIVILMVHGVADGQDNSSWTPLRPRLSPRKLDEYLTAISKRYQFISLADAVEMLQGRKPLQPYSVVLTFDDGYRNNGTHALPCLRRHRVPASFFLATSFLNDCRPFWFDRLDYALQHAQLDGREVTIGPVTIYIDGSSRETLRESLRYLRRMAIEQRMPHHEFLHHVERLAFQLETESGRALANIQSEDDWSAVLTWEQVEELADDEDVIFGSHTVDHVWLGPADADTARDQLVRSKRDIELHTGKPCLSLCYPNGSFTDETIRLAVECGYSCGLTVEEGLNSVGADVMKLRRINLPAETTDSDLLARMCMLSQDLSRVKGRMLSWLRTPTAGGELEADESAGV